jgi:hypothetical protein
MSLLHCLYTLWRCYKTHESDRCVAVCLEAVESVDCAATCCKATNCKAKININNLFISFRLITCY